MKIKRFLKKIGQIELSYVPVAPDHGWPELAVVLDGRIVPVATGGKAVALWNHPLSEEDFRALAERYARDPDPSGCPTHWQRVPELPPRGSRVAMVDETGSGNQYRFKVGGKWWLLRFLPPFDGRVVVMDQQGRVRVLPSFEEATLFLD